MYEIINAYRQAMPNLRFIGKKYGDGDRGADGGFGAQWGEFFEKGWFGVLEGLMGGKADETCGDGGAYIGLMRDKRGEPFQYWVGMFAPAGTQAPEGFEFVDFPASSLGVSWIKGPESEIYMKEEKCWERLEAEGMEGALDGDVACWFFERYQCPRFTEPDENGNVILDICFFVK